jgi:hypothetical protein
MSLNSTYASQIQNRFPHPDPVLDVKLNADPYLQHCQIVMVLVSEWR